MTARAHGCFARWVIPGVVVALCLLMAPRSEARRVAETERTLIYWIESELQRYYDEFGTYPISDERRTWWTELTHDVPLNSARGSAVWRMVDGELLYGRGIAFRYTPPSDPTVRVDPQVHPLLWWTGANGVFDGGTLDDFSPHRPAQIGYYWKRSWRSAFAWTILLGLCLPLAGWGAWVLGRRRWWVVWMVLVGYLIAAVFVLIPMYYKESSLFPAAWYARRRLLNLTGVVGSAYVIAVILTVIVRQGQRARLGAEGRCARCGYDLHGLEGERCPECGKEKALSTSNRQ